MRVAIALLAALSGCITEDEIDTSEVDQDSLIISPTPCLTGYSYSARGRSVARRYNYADCSKGTWAPYLTNPIGTQAKMTGSNTWTSSNLGTCEFTGQTVTAGDTACWIGSDHYMLFCSTTGVASTLYSATAYCRMAVSAPGSSIVSRKGPATWVVNPAWTPVFTYDDAAFNNTNSVAAVHDQTRGWHESCRSTSECPMTGICASYDLTKNSDGSFLGSYGARCVDDTELRNMQASTQFTYDLTYWDKAGNNIEGGTY